MSSKYVTFAPVDKAVKELTTISLTKQAKDDESITVKYELNTKENLKKAKENLSRSLKFKRKVVDDKNIRFEHNPGFYLEIKKKTDDLKRGLEAKDDNIGIEIKVTKTMKSMTKIKKDNPESIVWYEIKDIKSGLTYKCVQKMYNTNQTIHLQGGKRIGKVTSTSLVADFLEKMWIEILEEKKVVIDANIKAIKDMDIEQMGAGYKTKAPKKEPRPKYNCDMCDFKTIHLFEIRRHMYITHEIQIDVKSLSLKRHRNRQVEFNNKDEVVLIPDEELSDKSETIRSEISSPESKRHRTEAIVETNNKDENQATVAAHAIEIEVSSAVQNLEDTVKARDSEIKALKDKSEQQSHVLIQTQTDLAETKETLKKTDEEKTILKDEYENCYNAANKMLKEKNNLTVDYDEVVSRNIVIHKRNLQIEETLKVTEDILKAYEKEQAEDDDDEEEEEDDNMDFEDNDSTQADAHRKINSCKKCDKTFQNLEEMRKHEQSHKRDEKIIVKCQVCEYSSNDGTQLINHMSNEHHKHTCLTCQKEFMTMANLVEHVLNEHTKKTSPKDKCSQCGYEFENVDTLIMHIIKEHCLIKNGENTGAGIQLEQIYPVTENKCFDCGQNFRDKQDLNRHKRNVHFKQQQCRNFLNGYCRFPDHICHYIHNQQQNYFPQQEQHSQTHTNIPCRNGQSCTYKAQNRCKFAHVTNVLTNMAQSEVSRSTGESTMNSILRRLKLIELKVPSLNSLTDFPQMKEKPNNQ